MTEIEVQVNINYSRVLKALQSFSTKLQFIIKLTFSKNKTVASFILGFLRGGQKFPERKKTEKQLGLSGNEDQSKPTELTKWEQQTIT